MLDIILFFVVALLVVAIGFSLFIILKPYFLHNDTIMLFTGGNGSGKTFTAVNQAIIQLRKNRFERNIKNFSQIFKRKKNRKYLPKPLLYSNIPIRVGFREMSCKLTDDILLLQEKLPPLSVCLIDEINSVISQMAFKFKNEEILNEFVTFYRHITLGGHMILTTQNVNKIHWCFRYCANTSYNLCNFIKIGLPNRPILSIVKVRNISIGDDIKQVENGNVEEGRRNLIQFFPLFKRYDTYAFYPRYENVKFIENVQYKKLNRKRFLKMKLNEKVEFIEPVED